MPDVAGAAIAAKQVLRKMGYRSAREIPDGSPLGHRGFGAYLAPENSMEAVHAAFASGIRVINLDSRSLGDGTQALIHDATVDRTTTSTGNITDYSAATWLTLVEDRSVTFGGGWRDSRP